MLARVESAAVFGIDAVAVHVEVDVGLGLPGFSLVGLPDASIRESRDRVRAALRNSGFDVPPRRVTINLAPADVPKTGSAFDLPIALGVLTALGVVPERALRGIVLVGELSLDGTIQAARGILPIAVSARRRHRAALLLPAANAAEASVVEGVSLLPVHTLGEAVARLNDGSGAWPLPPVPSAPVHTAPPPDLADVAGQAFARRALEVAAAGGHNLLMVGPPGTGKTMLAERLPGILPPLDFDEALEATAIHSVAGLVAPGAGLLAARPFRAPHHTVSDAALVGGGSTPRPGEISLAHHGVLFLDEMPEFTRRALEVLRQPLEDGRVTIARARRVVTFPARFMLVGAMNPCPCGYRGDGRRPCRCTPDAVARYRGRLSGPLRDRLDIILEVAAVPFDALGEAPRGESSATVSARVLGARRRQAARNGPPMGSMTRTDGPPVTPVTPLTRNEGGPRLNAKLRGRLLLQHAALDSAGRRLLAEAGERLGLSARAYHRVLRVARTVADLAGDDRVGLDHLAEALQYRLVE